MKKIIFVVVIAISIVFASCGNMAVIDPGTFTFKHLHSDTYHNPMCFTI